MEHKEQLVGYNLDLRVEPIKTRRRRLEPYEYKKVRKKNTVATYPGNFTTENRQSEQREDSH